MVFFSNIYFQFTLWDFKLVEFVHHLHAVDQRDVRCYGAYDVNGLAHFAPLTCILCSVEVWHFSPCDTASAIKAFPIWSVRRPPCLAPNRRKSFPPISDSHGGIRRSVPGLAVYLAAGAARPLALTVTVSIEVSVP